MEGNKRVRRRRRNTVERLKNLLILLLTLSAVVLTVRVLTVSYTHLAPPARKGGGQSRSPAVYRHSKGPGLLLQRIKLQQGKPQVEAVPDGLPVMMNYRAAESSVPCLSLIHISPSWAPSFCI